MDMVDGVVLVVDALGAHHTTAGCALGARDAVLLGDGGGHPHSHSRELECASPKRNPIDPISSSLAR